MRTLILAGAVVTMLFTTAAAGDRKYAGPEFRALLGKIIRGRCATGTCSWFSIESAKPAGQSSRGQLFKLNTKSWYSRDTEGSNRRAPRRGGEEAISFVFCSKTSPAMIFQQGDGEWTARRLAPDNTSTIYGAVVDDYIMYWAACHGKDVNNSSYDDDERLAKKLGYNVKWPVNNAGYIEEKSLQRPADALKW
jgi:hypothetical protein